MLSIIQLNGIRISYIVCCEICLSTFLGSQFIINVDWEVLLTHCIDLLRPNSNIIQWTLILSTAAVGGGGGVFGENMLCHVRVSHYYV